MVDVTELQAMIQELLYGEAWFIPFLFIATVCIILVKVERYSAAIIIPCLLVLEGLYFQHNDGSGSMVWAILCTLLLMLFVAAMAVLQKDHK